LIVVANEIAKTKPMHIIQANITLRVINSS
jgi:hypothetical protein